MNLGTREPMPLAVLPSCLWVWELGLVHQVPDWPCLQTFPGVKELTSLEAHMLAGGWWCFSLQPHIKGRC